MRVIGLVKADWTHFLVLLEHLGMLEVAGQLSCSLNSSVAYLDDLFRVEPLPLPPMELVVEVLDKLRVQEVQERVPNVAVILS